MLLAPDIVFGHMRSKYGLKLESVATNETASATVHRKGVQTVEQLEVPERISRKPRSAAERPAGDKRACVRAARLAVPPSVYLSSKFDGNGQKVIVDEDALRFEMSHDQSAGPKVELMAVGDQDEVEATVEQLLGQAKKSDQQSSSLLDLEVQTPEADTFLTHKSRETQADAKPESEAKYDALTMRILGNLFENAAVDDQKLNKLVEESHELDAAGRPDFSSLMSGYRDQLGVCDRDTRMLNEDLHDLRALLGYCDILSHLDDPSTAQDSEALLAIREAERRIDELQKEAELRKRRAEIEQRMKEREAQKDKLDKLLRREKLVRLVRGEPTATRAEVQVTFRTTVRKAERAMERERADSVSRQRKREQVRDALQEKALSFADELLEDVGKQPQTRGQSRKSK